MGQNSNIEWTHHTFNPWRGCTKVSDGCKHCYADTLSKRNPGTLGIWGPNGTRVAASESYWREPLKWAVAAASAGERHRVFCASLADVGEGRDTMPAGAWDVVEGARLRLQATIRNTSDHLDWLLLTKRPENMVDLYAPDVLEMCWVGASVENQKAADDRIPHLLKIPAAVRFLSMEPLLGAVDLRLNGWSGERDGLPDPIASQIQWVIVGGESGHNARPMHPEWARSLRNQCNAAGVAFHFKQWGEWVPWGQIGSKSLPTKSDGRTLTGHLEMFDVAFDTADVYKVGKHAAGRKLDNRTWDELPAASAPSTSTPDGRGTK